MPASLKELQAEFMRFIEGEPVSELLQLKKEASSETELRIYKSSVNGGKLEALKTLYPVCCQLVGEDYFQQLASCYRNEVSHTSPDIEDYGVRFSLFLKAFKPVQAQIPYLPDVAGLEWACHLAYQSPRYSELDLEQLQTLSQEEQMTCVYSLPPCAQIIVSDYPVASIWKINQPENIQDNNTLNIDSTPQTVFVYRKDLDLHMVLLDPQERAFLEHIAELRPFDEVCGQLLEKYDKINLAALFGKSIEHGWIADFTTA